MLPLLCRWWSNRGQRRRSWPWRCCASLERECLFSKWSKGFRKDT